MESAVVITGGAGFIGCALGERLVRNGVKVIAVDNLHPQIHADGERPAAMHPEVELIIGDVTDAATWDGLLARWSPTVIFHLAAETGTGQSLTEATRHANVNVVGTTAMTDALARWNMHPDKIVLTSSRAVYGEGAWQENGEGRVFYPGSRTHKMLESGQWDPVGPAGGSVVALKHEAATIKPAPTSVYGATKLAQENILNAWCSAMGVDLKILRLQNVYGAGQSPVNPYTGIITLFHRIARRGDAIEVYEDGDIVRDFVYIDDVADAIMKVAEHDGASPVVDVGTGVPTSINEAARVIAEMHGAPAPVICGKFRDGDVRSAVADTQELSKYSQPQEYIGFGQGARLVGEWLVEKGFA